MNFNRVNCRCVFFLFLFSHRSLFHQLKCCWHNLCIYTKSIWLTKSEWEHWTEFIYFLLKEVFFMFLKISRWWASRWWLFKINRIQQRKSCFFLFACSIARGFNMKMDLVKSKIFFIFIFIWSIFVTFSF